MSRLSVQSAASTVLPLPPSEVALSPRRAAQQLAQAQAAAKLRPGQHPMHVVGHPAHVDIDEYIPKTFPVESYYTTADQNALPGPRNIPPRPRMTKTSQAAASSAAVAATAGVIAGSSGDGISSAAMSGPVPMGGADDEDADADGDGDADGDDDQEPDELEDFTAEQLQSPGADSKGEAKLSPADRMLLDLAGSPEAVLAAQENPMLAQEIAAQGSNPTSAGRSSLGGGGVDDAELALSGLGVAGRDKPSSRPGSGGSPAGVSPVASRLRAHRRRISLSHGKFPTASAALSVSPSSAAPAGSVGGGADPSAQVTSPPMGGGVRALRDAQAALALGLPIPMSMV